MKLIFNEEDSGLWIAYYRDGDCDPEWQLGAVYDVGMKVSGDAGSGPARYDALTGWEQVEPGRLIGSADNWQGACAILRRWVEAGSDDSGLEYPEYSPKHVKRAKPEPVVKALNGAREECFQELWEFALSVCLDQRECFGQAEWYELKGKAAGLLGKWSRV